MASIPIMCMLCEKSVKEDQFVRHMETAHGALSQSEAMAREGNIPKQQAPVVLDKEAAPTSDFMEVAQMLDAAPTPVKPPAPKPSVIANIKPVSAPPLVLKYRWEGDCKECSTPIRTVVVKAKGQTVAVALCLTHGEMEQREVANLEECEPLAKFDPSITENQLKDMVETPLKASKEKKNGK